MSGGVDSSVAAALLVAQGHEVVGATMKLWGGPSDSGCCSVADTDDARRVAQQLGIAHHVFNFTEDFERRVVDPYISAHAAGLTPNPCTACNAHLKFDRFLVRARQLGFDAIATGHHARVSHSGGLWCLRRGRDLAKDQSYVLHMLGQDQLSALQLPVGELTKEEVRRLAAQAGLRTATKPDSQDVCFISKDEGRGAFLGDRIPLRPGRLVTRDGREVGRVSALELVTVGQRRGLGLGPPGSRSERHYVVGLDLAERTATVGPLEDLLVSEIRVLDMRWVSGPLPAGAPIEAQMSAHGRIAPGYWGEGIVSLREPVRRVAPGQAVVLYLPDPQGGDLVVGGGVAA